MLETLFAMHNEVMTTIPQGLQRYLYNEINWNNQAICILGDRGVGKTILSCQYLQNVYRSPEQGLYISADNINVLAAGLFNTAREYFASGGTALCIDKVHKYPNWPSEINNIIDTYKTKKIIILGSSAIDSNKTQELSPRIIKYSLQGLSFREFLNFKHSLNLPAYSLDMIMSDHVTLASQFTGLPILKYFNEYLSQGYYPFFLEGPEDYCVKVNKLIEQVIYEDIAIIYGLKQTTLLVLKQILWLIATSDSLKPNIDKISKSVQVSREVIYSCMKYLNRAGLILNLFEDNKGQKLVRKPGKTYLNNTSLLHAINGNTKLARPSNTACEIMLANQVSLLHQLQLHETANFIINDKHLIEMNKPTEAANNYQIIDDIDVGDQHKIPLYLFGFLY